MNLAGLSDADLEAISAGDMSRVSDAGLEMLAASPEQKKEMGGVEKFGRGVMAGGEGLYVGAKQRLGVEGADAEAEALKAENAPLMESWQGQLGAAAPIIAATALPLGRAMGRGALGAMAESAGVGAVAGALRPTTGEDSVLANMAREAMTYGAGAGLFKGAGAIANALRKRLLPDEAVAALAARMGSAGKASSAVDDLATTAQQRLDDVSARHGAAYTAAEAPRAGTAAVNITPPSQGNLPELVTALRTSESPVLKQLTRTLEREATTTSPILQASGQPFKYSTDFTLQEARQASRDLGKMVAAASRSAEGAGAPRAQMLMGLRNQIKQDIDAWGTRGASEGTQLAEAKAADAAWSAEVLPLRKALGLKAGEKVDPVQIAKALRSPDANMRVAAIKSNVPGSERALRSYAGELLTRNPNAINKSMLQEVLTKEEQQYVSQIIAAKGDKGAITRMLDRLPVPVLRNVLRYITREGVLPMGTTAKGAAQAGIEGMGTRAIPATSELTRGN